MESILRRQMPNPPVNLIDTEESDDDTENSVFSFVPLKGCKRRCVASPLVKGDWFETYRKAKDINLWLVIVYGYYKPTIKNKDTRKEDIIPYENLEESHKKMHSKNDEAKMVLYNALRNKQVKDNKIDLFVQKYEEFTISDDETIDSAFARFNNIITSLKALDESFSSRNHVRKFLRALPTMWHPKVTTIEESKDLSTLPLDELIAKKISSDEEVSCSSSSDEEYALAKEKKEKEDQRCFKCGDPNHFISDCPKHFFNDQKEFVGGCWSDSEEEDDSKKDEICLVALDNNEVRLKAKLEPDE
ncbi:zf-CCHC domain-containing protein [Tanacetum coccineum]